MLPSVGRRRDVVRSKTKRQFTIQIPQIRYTTEHVSNGYKIITDYGIAANLLNERTDVPSGRALRCSARGRPWLWAVHGQHPRGRRIPRGGFVPVVAYASAVRRRKTLTRCVVDRTERKQAADYANETHARHALRYTKPERCERRFISTAGIRSGSLTDTPRERGFAAGSRNSVYS